MSYPVGCVPNEIEEELDSLEKACKDAFDITDKEINEQLANGCQPEEVLAELLTDFASIKNDILNLKEAALLTNGELHKTDMDFSDITEEKINDLFNCNMDKAKMKTVREDREAQSVKDLEKLRANKNQNDGNDSDPEILDESDLIVTQTVETFIDPISKVAIQHPLKNKYCGHYFEKSVVLEYVSNQYKKCPHIGCNRYMSSKDLIEDHELRAKITKAQGK